MASWLVNEIRMSGSPVSIRVKLTWPSPIHERGSASVASTTCANCCVHVRRQAVLDLDGVGQRSLAGAHGGRGSRHDVPGAAARGREVGARRERAGGDRRRDVAVGVPIVRVRHCARGDGVLGTVAVVAERVVVPGPGVDVLAVS